MGLLDRVKQNQTVPPAPTGGTNGPAVGTMPGAATTYGAPTSIPIAPQAATSTAPPAPSLSQRAAASVVGGDLTPAFTAAKVQIHARLIEKYADQIDSSNKPGVREKILELAEEYFRSTAMTMTKNDKERLVDSVHWKRCSPTRPSPRSWPTIRSRSTWRRPANRRSRQ